MRHRGDALGTNGFDRFEVDRVSQTREGHCGRMAPGRSVFGNAGDRLVAPCDYGLVARA